jgi:hypothetical protein
MSSMLQASSTFPLKQQRYPEHVADLPALRPESSAQDATSDVFSNADEPDEFDSPNFPATLFHLAIREHVIPPYSPNTLDRLLTFYRPEKNIATSGNAYVHSHPPQPSLTRDRSVHAGKHLSRYTSTIVLPAEHLDALIVRPRR